MEDEEKYIPGSIVRVRLSNFVTYSAVEFRPGPYLNMVLGPNGTGKSTIVCAIALGLGGKPEILGRAKEVKDFVRKSTTEAVIEIEIKGTQKNIVIERRLHAANNRSTWAIDGNQATEQAVKDRILKCNIQVDNLCQFLPQDRVSEFAQVAHPTNNMLPPQLLQETERAIGSPKLLSHHKELIKARNELKAEETVSASGEVNHLAVLKRKLGPLQEEVEKLKDREKCLQDIRIIELAIPWEKYEMALNDYKEVKDRRNVIRQQREDYESEVQPLRESLDFAQSLLESNAKDFSTLKSKYEDCSRKAKAGNAAIEAAEEKQKNQIIALKSAKQQFTKTAQTIKGYKASLADKREELQNFTRELDERGFLDENGECDPTRSDEFNFIANAMEKINNSLSECLGNVGAVQSRAKEIFQEKTSIDRSMAACENSLRRLHETSNQKLEAVRRVSEHTYRAVEWFRENQRTQQIRFEKTVFEPICLHVNVKNPDYAASVETIIGKNTLMNFVVQTREDYKALTRQILDVLKLRCNVVMLDSSMRLEPAMTRNEIRSLGFDGYLLDFLDGPDEVIRAACQISGIHTIPVSLRPIERLSSIEAEQRLKSYVIANSSYTVKRNYGASSTRIFGLQEPFILKLSLNTAEEERLNHELRNLKGQLQEATRKLSELQDEEKEYRNQDATLRGEKAKLFEKKKELLSLRQSFQKRQQDLGHYEAKIQREEADLAEYEQEIKKLQSSSGRFLTERANLALNFLNLQAPAVELFEKRLMYSLRDIELLSQKKFIEEKLNSIRDRNSAIETAWQNGIDCLLAALSKRFKVTRELEHAKSQARVLKESAENITTEYTIEERQEMTTIRNGKTLPDLEDLLGQYRARAEIMSCNNTRALEDFKALEAEIHVCEKKLETRTNRMEQARNKMQTLKDEWLPELERLTKLISDAFSKSFERIGCAGEVQIQQDDDYEKWGININVKFRYVLHILGIADLTCRKERSVSTILYLMALQQVSRAPFRVVDEINQGMDPRNERMVHSQIVETACQEGNSQYFLITPKLLPDLEYHPKMKVLVIYNGEHQPKTFDFKAFIDKKKAAGKQKKHKRQA
ncbi:Structural maintenance of chromosomes protein 5 [Phlyctochytrium planicorne]|nr:Structural maintenance of chromosomes protein 5 [Phlyctochytrium planicorne]